MTRVAIRADRLGKRYRIGTRERYRALRDTLADFAYGRVRSMASALRRRRRAAGKGPSGDFIWALKDVTFEVAPSEVVGIIGSNGAGKTTLLKILSRITEPTEGGAEIHGRVGSLLEVGTGFHPELTGRENIYLNGAILGMKRAEIERKLDEIVAFAGVERFIDTPVKRYSSGMYMRLAFAVAAHLQTEILLVDEVLAVGDAEFQEKCIGRMAEVSDEGRTVLFVSHNMDAILKLSSRVIWLEGGSTVLDGSSNLVVKEYLQQARRQQAGTKGTVSLRDHPGRWKAFDGVVRLVHCRVVGEGGAKPLVSGGECRIIVGYESQSPLSGGRVNFVVGIRGGASRRLASCWSQLTSEGLDRLGTTGQVECYIPRLPLLAGTYLLDVGCQVGGGWSDVVYEAVSVDVAPGGFYSSGRLPSSDWGQCLVDHVWRKSDGTG